MGKFSTESARSYQNVASVSGDIALTRTCRGAFIGGAGDFYIEAEDGTVGEHKNVPAGSTLSTTGTKILAATSATDIVIYF